MPTYQDEFTALKYLDFLNSHNGELQQHFLFGAILGHLPKNPGSIILDAGCGPGWLAAELKKHFADVFGCDASEFFIKFAKATHKNIDFKLATLDKLLPYPQNSFDVVILNMVGPDLNNLSGVFKNLSAVIKPSGKLIATIPNPKYTYPVAEWKRSWLDILLMKKPTLKSKLPYRSYLNIEREFNRAPKEPAIKITSNFYTLEDYVSAASPAGLKLQNTHEIKSAGDSPHFDLTYQLHRYPLLLLLEFEKLGQ